MAPTIRTTRPRQSALPNRVEPRVAIVITADHVYLPIDEAGNVGTPWTVSDVSTSRVSRRTRLLVPPDLARFLSDRDQAEITTPASTSEEESSFAKATEDKSSVAPTLLRSRGASEGGSSAEALAKADRSVGG